MEPKFTVSPVLCYSVFVVGSLRLLGPTRGADVSLLYLISGPLARILECVSGCAPGSPSLHVAGIRR
eukprot:3542398-Pyramimonas_sp.AAC.1